MISGVVTEVDPAAAVIRFPYGMVWELSQVYLLLNDESWQSLHIRSIKLV